MPYVVARLRVTVDCPECASPIPVNGIAEEVLCQSCQAVVNLFETPGWQKILSYQKDEGILEHKILIHNKSHPVLDYFLAGPKGGALYRKWRGILVEVDGKPIECPKCKAALDPAALAAETKAEGQAVEAFCPGCGGKVPIRAPEKRDQHIVHKSCVALVGETAPRTSLAEPDGDKVLFSCLGCGAPLSVQASTPRMLECQFCSATSYIPDALWLRLHPAQRKRPFWAILDATPEVLAAAKKLVTF